MTRKSKKYQLLVITLLLCILQVAGIDVYAQSTVTPMKRDTTITQREAPKARARRHREPAVQDSLKKDSIRIVPSKELVPLDSLSAASIQIADSLDAANKKELKKIEQPASIMVSQTACRPQRISTKRYSSRIRPKQLGWQSYFPAADRFTTANTGNYLLYMEDLPDVHTH